MAHPGDFNAAHDLTLVQAARAGDRLAFGVLYLRHHAAAWRVACVASRFSPDAELAVIEGFTRVFPALPEESEDFETGGVTFRPYLLACVRQSALDRASAARRQDAADEPPVPLAGLGPDGEVVLSSLEHHVARSALASLPERCRTALWLSDVEAMTPGEVAGIVGGQPEEMPGLTAGARAEIHTAQQTALGRQEVRAGCRFTVDHLDAYRAGSLDPTDGLIIRSHLGGCPPCRMRQGELSIAPAALAGAVPAAPLLGGEAQHHWITSVGATRPAERLLPPILAAGGTVPREPLGRRTVTRLGTVAGAAITPARGLPDALRRARRAAAGSWRTDSDSIDLTTRPAPPGWTDSPGWSGSPTPALPPAWTIPPGRAAAGGRPRPAGAAPRRVGARSALVGVPVLVRRAKGSAGALSAVALGVAWVLVMMALPRLMAPSTAPGPGGLALPAVQAYVPGFSLGGDKASSTSNTARPAATGFLGSRGTQAAASANDDADRGSSGSAGAAEDEPSIGLIAAGSRAARPNSSGSGRAGPRTGQPAGPAPGAIVAALVPVPAAATSPLTLIPAVVTAPSAASNLDAPISPQSIDRPGPSVAPKPDQPEKAHKPKADKPKKPKAAKVERPAAVKPDKSTADRAKRPGKTAAERPSHKADRARRTGGPAGTHAVPKPRIITA